MSKEKSTVPASLNLTNSHPVAMEVKPAVEVASTLSSPVPRSTLALTLPIDPDTDVLVAVPVARLIDCGAEVGETVALILVTACACACAPDGNRTTAVAGATAPSNTAATANVKNEMDLERGNMRTSLVILRRNRAVVLGSDPHYMPIN